MKNFEQLAQECWAAKTVDLKKEVLYNMIDLFDHKKKAHTFREQVDKFTSGRQLDRIAANIMLRDTDKVV